jgi:phenylacetate-CoA ligase
MNFRKFSFDFLDRLRGGKVKQYSEEVAHTNNWETNEQLGADRVHLSILEHAKESTAFYKSFNSARLEDFPVIDKTIIREQPKAFISKHFRQDELIRMVTSGSTGTPFITYHDKNKKLRNTADTIYASGKAGYNLGERIYYLKIWSGLNKKNSFTQWKENIKPVDVLYFNQKEIAQFLRDLEDYTEPQHLIGYASALEKLAKYLEDKNIVLKKGLIKSAIAMSEALSDFTKVTLQNRMNVKVCSRYSNIENGIIAQQTPLSGMDFWINRASYYVEILDIESDCSVPAGSLGRIVVTDLYNYGMPLIRYDTGDLGTFAVTENGQINSRKLARIEGRKMDILLNTSGEIVSSYIIYKNMWEYTEIEQYQLVQNDRKDYCMKINTADGFNREDKLIAEFKSYLGEDAKFKIEYVKEIPLLDSGKRRKVVNNYIKSPKSVK